MARFPTCRAFLDWTFPTTAARLHSPTWTTTGVWKLSSRTGIAPQLRILRNAMKEIGNSIAFRLRGKKSNRDAIGAAVTVEAEGHRQTKYLQAGSGFLSQHTKELFFGVGKAEGTVRATIRWPSGLTQVFEHLPVNRRIEIEEGSEDFAVQAFCGCTGVLRAGERQSKAGGVAFVGRDLAHRALERAGVFLARPCGKYAGSSVVPRRLRCFSTFGQRLRPLAQSRCAFFSSTRPTSHPAGFA